MKHRLFRLLLIAMLLAEASSAAPILYQISLNTSSQLGNHGYLDFQFNPGAGAAAATATISNFVLIGGSFLPPSGALFPLPYNTPTATGDLSSAVVIENTDAFNAFLQELNFGDSINFRLTLDGAALETSGNAGGTDFSLFAYDSTGAIILGGSNGAGAAAIVSIDANGGVSDTTGTGGAVVSALPEPSSVLMLLGGICLVAGKRWNKL